MHRFIIVIPLLCSCALPVYIHTEAPATPENAREIIKEGAAFLDVKVRFVPNHDDAAVTVEFVKPTGNKCGLEVREALCQRKVQTCTGPVFAGHEIGHALGLKHTCEREDEEPGGKGCPGNLMDFAPPSVNPTVTDEQKTIAKASTVALAACRKAL